MNILLVALIAPLWIVFLVVQLRRDVLARQLYTLVRGTSQGYSWRIFRENMETFCVPQHEELARKVKAWDRLATRLLMVFIILSFLITAIHELGWL